MVDWGKRIWWGRRFVIWRLFRWFFWWRRGKWKMVKIDNRPQANRQQIRYNTMKIFKEKVLEVVKKIPKGKVITYGEVAKRAGNPNASRAVGSYMARNEDKNVPCHRVVKSDGSIGMYNGLQGKSKLEILKKEGVTFTKSGKAIL
jgi:O-6-methylguanine DNA methyltransferase